MSDLGTMQTRIANELARSDLTTEIAAAIQTAITFYERQRFHFNEGKSTAATVANQQSYALPTDFLYEDLLEITVNSTKYGLTKQLYQDLERSTTLATFTGWPSFYAMYDEKLWLYPIPNGVYTLTMPYVKRLAALSLSADTNAWMTSAEEVIRQRAKAIVKVDVLESDGAKAEAMRMQDRGSACLNGMEQSALMMLRSEATQRMSTGSIKATRF